MKPPRPKASRGFRSGASGDISTQDSTRDNAITNPTDKDLLAALLGPSGNLRAPAIVSGDTLLVGFSIAAAQSAGLG